MADASSSPSVKETFSGPSDILNLAHQAADPKGRYEAGKWIVGENGAWSRWVTLAVYEKLVRDGHWPTPANEKRAELLGYADALGLDVSIDALRTKLRATAAA